MVIAVYAECALTVLVALAAYLYLTVSLYPSLALRPVWRDKTSAGDRGLRRVVSPEGYATVYRPALRSCAYLHRYALIRRDGSTFIKCRIHEGIAYIRYDVAAFSSKGKLLDVITVSERVAQRGYTRSVRLPRMTAYVCVTLRKADGVYLDQSPTLGYALPGMLAYVGLCVATAVAVSLLLRGSLAAVAELHPALLVVQSRGLSAVLGGLCGAACAACGALAHHHHCGKVLNP